MSDVTLRGAIADERPLGRTARTSLVVAAAATILLFYLVALLAGLLLGVIVLVLFAALLGAARFGLATFLRRPVRQHAELVALLARSFWLKTATAYRIPLQRSDAPRLFAILDDLSNRMHVAAPREVLLEMHGNAWVQLRGYRQGSGRTILGVGYDLLAGLSESQVTAVLAHEMTHAKLVQRGLSRWMTRGLGRLATLTGQLSAHASAYRRANYRSQVGEALHGVFDALTTRAARLVATYSRQDEFEADRGAAEICGAAALRSALIRLESLDQDLARVPWNERIARVQLGRSFSRWLVNEIARSNREDASDVVAHAHDPYSTHPSLRDRLGALPADVGATVAERPGVELLGDPDRTADRLMTEILRVVAEQEAKDTKVLARSARKTLGASRAKPLQWLGMALVAVGLFLMIVALTDEDPWIIASTVGTLGAGVLLIRFGGYRDRVLVPIPLYGTLTKDRPATETVAEMKEAEAEIVAELEKHTASITSKRARVAALVTASYAALADRDYLRAHVAARLGLKENPKSAECGLAYAIAAGGLHNATQALDMLKWVRAHTGLKTPNTQWGTVWALAMIDTWGAAEGLLALMQKKTPNQPTFLSLLALAQLNRGKLQSAIRNSERACAIEPSNPHHVKLLIGVLLTAGQVREAHRRLAALGSAVDDDLDHLVAWLRLSLMEDDAVAARTWATRVRSADRDRKWTIAVGTLFESSRFDADATAVYTDALATAFYPEAYLGLARIASHRADRATARSHLLSALNLELPLATNATSALSLFGDIVQRLRELEERRVSCTAWLAAFAEKASPAALAGHSLVVCAPDREAAEEQVRTIVTAMQPSAPPFDVSTLEWKEAPKERQPVRPIHPGIQAVIAADS